MCYWSPQDTYYIRSLYQDVEMQQVFLIYRNRHKRQPKSRDKEMCVRRKNRRKFQEKITNQMEASNLAEIEFKTLVVRMFKELRRNFNKKIISTKKNTETIKNQK